MWKNLKPQASTQKAVDYGDYVLSGREKCLYLAEGLLLVGIFAYFFYRSIGAFLLLTPSLFLFLKQKKKELAEKRRKELRMQFKDAILSVSANQKAGYSVENTFREAYRDMAMLYGEESPVCRELYVIDKGLASNVALEKLLYDFGCRSHIQDIMQFAEVFLIAKRNGGNMTEILSETANTIEQKSVIDNEIDVLLSARKLEQKIMNVVPFFIIFYINLTSRGFFDVLYHNPIGILIMTVCLAVYFAAYKISGKIVAIEI